MIEIDHNPHERGAQPKPYMASTATVIVGAGFVLAGFGILAFQAYSFLRFGTWVPMSLIDCANAFFDKAWLREPREWVGLHWLLDKVPASLVAIVIGYGTILSE